VVGTLTAIASVLAWLSAPLTAPARPAAATELAAEPNRLVLDTTPQQLSPGAQESAVGSTEPDAPLAASSGPVTTPLQPIVATKQLEREIVEPQDEAGAHAPPYCFSAFNISFTHNSALPITNGLGHSIELLRRLMMEHPDAALLVEGHADSTGTEQYNVLLSFSRAKSVADLLNRLGIPIRRMTVRAAGASEAKDKAAGLASDRRTSVRIEGVDNCNSAEGATDR
jgi:outer membrane protein OmpA-like peptidoglycan-associated protein